MAIWITGHLLALLVGLSLGLVGSGGSILAVPILVYVLGLEPRSAIAMSLAIIGIVSLIGVIPHWKQGNINFKNALTFTPPAMLGAFLGARLATLSWLSDTFILVCFAIVTMVAGYLMIHQPKDNLNDHVELFVPKQHQSKYPWLVITLKGLAVGMLTSFVGIGGSFVVIPALIRSGKILVKEAIGTSLLIIAFKSAAGFVGYLNRVSIDWNSIFTFTTVTILGVIWGAYFSGKMHITKLQRGLGYFLIAVAIFVLVKS